MTHVTRIHGGYDPFGRGTPSIGLGQNTNSINYSSPTLLTLNEWMNNTLYSHLGSTCMPNWDVSKHHLRWISQPSSSAPWLLLYAMPDAGTCFIPYCIMDIHGSNWYKNQVTTQVQGSRENGTCSHCIYWSTSAGLGRLFSSSPSCNMMFSSSPPPPQLEPRSSCAFESLGTVE